MSPGFANVGEFADSATVDGQCWTTGFRKMTSAVTIAGQWFDYSQGAGNPPANFYASSPLVAARLDGMDGIHHGPAVSPAKKYVHRVLAMIAAASATSTTAQNMTTIWLDYLLYYPFIDMDAAGEDQTMTNGVTLPRFTDGAGVRMMAVAQGASVGGGTFTVNYTNQAGTAGRVTPLHYCAAAQPAGALVSASTAAGGVQPFVALQAGDTGVRSVQSVNFALANGGLLGIVLVVPIWQDWMVEECRRTTSSTLESFGSPSEKEAIRQRAGVAQRIHDGAFISFIAHTTAGSVASAQIVGLLETVWR